MKFKLFFFAFLFVLSFNISKAQDIQSEINQKLTLTKSATFQETLIGMGKSFLGVPYAGQTLEGPKEMLICKLDGLDCYTFVENVMALTITLYDAKPSFEKYKSNLKNLRYRNGSIAGYSSRIHYFSEWAMLAAKNGYLDDVTKAKGSVLPKKLNFMSMHRKSYKAFSEDNWVLSQIQLMEKGLESNQIYHFPKSQFAANQKLIKDGDIVAFTSTVDGLDVNHEGFAVWENGVLKFIHASLEKKKVIISSESILEYINRIAKHAGVMVLRPKLKA
jgi:cell wall-associated NlpC family hydrolase